MKFKRGKHGGNIFFLLSYNIEPRATQVQIPTHVLAERGLPGWNCREYYAKI